MKTFEEKSLEIIKEIQKTFEARFYSHINNNEELNGEEMSNLIRDISEKLISELNEDLGYPKDLSTMIVIGAVGSSFKESLGKIPENYLEPWNRFLKQYM